MVLVMLIFISPPLLLNHKTIFFSPTDFRGWKRGDYEIQGHDKDIEHIGFRENNVYMIDLKQKSEK